MAEPVDRVAGWREFFDQERNKPYFQKLKQFVTEEYRKGPVYPAPQEIFSAFRKTPEEHVRVVIVGQDPYHHPGQAHGMAFSVPRGVTCPPSLMNIFQELNRDVGIRNHVGDLTGWAQQGVLLLNSTLTVRAYSPGSHMNRGWEQFTDAVLQRLIATHAGLIFVLWGKHAQQKCQLLLRHQHSHTVLTASHPSPLSAYRGFFGCSHFSKINIVLKKQNKPEINWQLS